MQLAKIIGTVIATRKAEGLISSKLMVIQPVNYSKKPVGEAVIAVDTVGAGVGELVFFVTGSVAYHIYDDKPCDAAIVGIVDSISIEEGEESNIEK